MHTATVTWTAMISTLVCAALGTPVMGQVRKTPLATLAVVSVTADAKGFLTYDRDNVIPVEAHKPVTLRLKPGRYFFEATSASGEFWRQEVVLRPGSKTVAVDFAAAAASLAQRKAKVAELHESADRTEKEIARVNEAQAQVSANVTARREAEASTIRKIQALIDAIGGLEKQLEAYTETAATLKRDADELASAGGSDSVGQLIGLVGTIGARSKKADSDRNALHARGVLLRMNRLTTLLTNASDNQYTQVSDSADSSGVYIVVRGGARGRVVIDDDKIAYRDTQAPPNKTSAPLLAIDGTCKDLRSATRSGDAVNVRFVGKDFKPDSLKLELVVGRADDLLADLAISCPSQKL